MRVFNFILLMMALNCIAYSNDFVFSINRANHQLFVDIEGNVLYEIENIFINEESENFFVYLPTNQKRPNMGLLDKLGNEVLPAEYRFIRLSTKDYAVVASQSFTKVGIYNLFDRSFVFDPIYRVIRFNGENQFFLKDLEGQWWSYHLLDGALKNLSQWGEILSVSGDYGLYKKDNLYGFWGPGFNNVFQTEDFYISKLNDGVAIYYFDQNSSISGYIRSDGKILTPANFFATNIFSNGYASAFVGEYKGDPNGYWVILDKNFNETARIPLEKIYWMFNFSEGLCRFYSVPGGLWGYVNSVGEIVIPAKFEKANDFKNGYAKIRIDGLDNYIDKNGILLFDF